MLATKLARVMAPTLHQGKPIQIAFTSSQLRSKITWAFQDNWEDPSGPMGIHNPSPKLAALTTDSPQWLHDLHKQGVSHEKHINKIYENSKDY